MLDSRKIVAKRINRLNWLFWCGLGTLGLHGCSWHEWTQASPWNSHFRTPLPTLNPDEEAVAQLDIATMRWRAGEATLEHDIWPELDEQFIPLEQKRLFAQHGLRVGLMRAATGTRTQAILADPKLAKPINSSMTDGIIRWWTYVGDKLVEAPRPMPICSIETRRVVARADSDLFWPLGPKVQAVQLHWPHATGPSNRTFNNAELGISAHLQKLPNGSTRVALVPIVKHVINQPEGSDIFLDALRNKTGVQYQEERLEPLALDVTLGHDQYLVITAQPSESTNVEPDMSSWGETALLDAAAAQQIMLVIRGASVAANRIPDQPRKGQAWPLAWQAAELAPVNSPNSATPEK